jgi:hypothetical protein
VSNEIHKADILFVVDNSASTQAKNDELRTHFARFADLLAAGAATHPAWYHIGVITIDLGSGPYTIGQQCRPGGEGGKLQAAPAAGVTGLPAECSTLKLADGVRFIDYNQLRHRLRQPADARRRCRLQR